MVIVAVLRGFGFKFRIRAFRAGSVMTMVPMSVLFLITSVAVGLSTGASFVPTVSLDMIPCAVVASLLILLGWITRIFIFIIASLWSACHSRTSIYDHFPE